ncbi:hypothetical protein ABK040_001396 [Willaertia magna]
MMTSDKIVFRGFNRFFADDNLPVKFDLDQCNYCSMAVYTSKKNYSSIDQVSEEIRNILLNFKTITTSAVTNEKFKNFYGSGKIKFDNKLLLFQQFYSNCYSDAKSTYSTHYRRGLQSKIRKNATKQLQAKELFKDFAGFTNWKEVMTPLVSTTTNLGHALKYAIGEDKKYPGNRLKYRPLYSTTGEFKDDHDGTVGCCVVFTFNNQKYLELAPNDVFALDSKGLLHIDPRIVSENEVSFLGYIPKDNIEMHSALTKGQYEEFGEFFKVHGTNFSSNQYETKFKELVTILKEHIETIITKKYLTTNE